jgi:hypothetical protein
VHSEGGGDVDGGWLMQDQRSPTTRTTSWRGRWAVLQALRAACTCGYSHSSGLTQPFRIEKSLCPRAVARWTVGNAPNEMRVPRGSMGAKRARLAVG